MTIKTNKGFSLMEVLLAFTILTMSLSVILKIFTNGNNTAALSESYSIAIMIAESRLASVSATNISDNNISVGTEFDRYNWELIVEPYFDDDMYEDVPQLFQIRVLVTWKVLGKNYQIELQSLRFLPKTFMKSS